MIFIIITILIPLLIALGLLISPLWPMKKVVNRKKFGSLIAISIVISAMVCGGLYFGAHRKLYFKEVWNYKFVSVKHEEQWTTREMRTRQVACGTDKDGNTIYRTEIYYVTETHGPYWTAKNEYGKWQHVSSSGYKKYSKLWGEKKTGFHRGSTGDDWVSVKSGNIYGANWGGEFEKLYPHSAIHEYVNKARVTKNTINQLPKPTEAQQKKYPRPVDEKNTSPIISHGPSFSEADIMSMRRSNAVLGRDYEIHAMIVAFNAKDGRGQIREVLTAWEGTNKNELVMFVGLDKNCKVEWCEVHNWLDMGDSTVNNMWRDHVMGEVLDVPQAAKVLREIVPKYWSRPQGASIDYLQVDIHWGWGLGAFLAVISITTGAFFVVEYKIFDNVNEFGEDRYSRWGY